MRYRVGLDVKQSALGELLLLLLVPPPPLRALGHWVLLIDRPGAEPQHRRASEMLR